MELVSLYLLSASCVNNDENRVCHLLSDTIRERVRAVTSLDDQALSSFTDTKIAQFVERLVVASELRIKTFPWSTSGSDQS